MKYIYKYNLIICLLFYVVEAKPCPERTRPHKSRCEAYYKCVDLPPRRHVWIPEKCESGLVYEHNLSMCVLPADDWECMPNVKHENSSQNSKENRITQHNDFSKNSNEADILMINNKDFEQKHQIINENDNNHHENKNMDNDVEIIFEKTLTNEAGELEDKGMEMQDDSDDNKYDNKNLNKRQNDVSDQENFDEGSGNGGESVELEGFQPVKQREGDDVQIKDETTSTSKIDPKLTQHLQRLSQLIDGLKQGYQANNDKPYDDLKPDQLNAFLTHFNIRNNFNTLSSNDNYRAPAISSTTPPPVLAASSTLATPLVQIQLPQVHINGTSENNKLRPETKLLFSNYYPNRYDYGNSQIVVNRPEASITFSLPPYTGQHYGSYEDSPKISEDTLKTVLELSKQMIATQNIPHALPNPNYYGQPIIQPVIFPANSFHSGMFSALSPNYVYPNRNSGKKKNNKKASATIIHNNVHLNSASSGEKAYMENYGNQLYSPYSAEHYQRPGHSQQNIVASVTTVRPMHAGLQKYTPQYSAEISVTTASPLEFQVTPATIDNFYTPAPHLNDQTANMVFYPTERYPMQKYGQIPMPTNLKRPSSSQLYNNYQAYMEQQSGAPVPLFPTQIDPNKIKIRPNSQKFDSHEENDAEEYAAYQQQLQLQQDQFNNLNNYFLPTGSSTTTTTTARPSMHFNSYTKTQTRPHKNFEGVHLVHFGGNYMPFSTFEKDILPLLGPQAQQGDLGNIEMITCATGVRQQNTTDCTRYYVCSKKDGKVLTYSCPPYTAFNDRTRICDANTYATCGKDTQQNSQSYSFYALQEAQRRREQALKAQQSMNKFLQNNQHNINNNHNNNYDNHNNEEEEPLNNNNNEEEAYMQDSVFSGPVSSSTTTVRPNVKKRKYFCKEGDKVADHNSIYNYFVCYKNAEGRMKGHKMTCPSALIFCADTRICTLSERCK